MGRIEKTVFISYRRTNAIWALAIFKDLTHHGYDVFFDYNGIASGDFERVIVENINARAHFLVLLTPSALEECADADDWLRREIETALDTKRNIVALMLEGFDFNTPGIANQLTGKIAALKRYNGLGIPVAFFDEAMARLRERYLNVSLDAVLHPASPTVQQVAQVQQTAAAAAPAVQGQELTAQGYFERGFEATDLNEKLRFYDQALRLKADYAEALNNRAVLHKARGDLARALEDVDAALRLKPDDARVFNNRGLVRQAQGDIAAALEDFDAALHLKPNYVEALNNRGVLRNRQGDLTGALADFDALLRLNPDYFEALNNRAVLRKARGDLAGARQDYDAALGLKPHDARVLHNRGLLRERQGDVTGAREDFDAALRLQSEGGES